MLPSQRELFDIPREVAYLNAAAWSPLPKAVQEAGQVGATRKGQPWKIDGRFSAAQNDRARRAAAALIDAAPEDVALIPSVSYGVATVGKILAVPKGSRVLLLQDDHSSPVLEWLGRAAAQGFTVETVAQPADGDWTAALLAAIERPGAPPVGLASISSVHWSDGGEIDLAPVAAALRRQGGALLVDATHSVGAAPVDVRAIDPDFLLFPTYKWVLGPYGRAFLYIAKRRQDGVPLEQTGYGRRGVSAEQASYLGDLAYVEGARRFDMGERDFFISMTMAAVGMEMVAGWQPAAIRARLGQLTQRLTERLEGLPVHWPRHRAPHLLSLGFRDGMPAGLIERLAAEQVYGAPRLGRLRLSPHVYNDEADIDRVAAVLRRALG